MFGVIVFFEKSQERNQVVLWDKTIVYFVGFWYYVHTNFVQNMNKNDNGGDFYGNFYT